MSQPVDHLIGQMLGQFEIIDVIGHGGMATVYRARQRAVEREVAIKVMRPGLLNAQTFIRRFRREAQTIGALSHPHILKIFDYGQHEDILYLVIELLAGGSLAEWIRQGPLTPEATARILPQVAAALDHAHERGIVHRDLKPQNVLFDINGNVFLADFGIARLMQLDTTALTESNVMLGTPRYMAPEQWRGEVVDGRADIYALGIMLFEMLSGHPPFQGESPHEMLHAHLYQPTPSLNDVRPEMSTGFDQIIRKATDKNPEQRFATAGEIVAAFQVVLSGQALALTPLRDEPTIALRVPRATQGFNPFFHRGAIRQQPYFVDREYETRQILSLLQNGQSVSLVGQRRIGKTSLLWHVSDPHVLTQHRLNPAEYLFVYLDCGSLAQLDQPGIYSALLDEVGDALAEREVELPEMPQPNQPLTFRAFERALRDLLRQGLKLTLVLDEFELMSRNPALDSDFFSGLRALATRHAIAFATASKQPLLELTYAHSSTLSSPFFNIFAAVRLNVFSKEAAHHLLQQLVGIGGQSFNEPTLSAMVDFAGPHPLFLQIVGYHAFELQQAKGAFLTQEDLPALFNQARADLNEHLSYYWRNLTDPERRLLATLPASQPGGRELLRSLEQQCLIVHLSDNQGYDYLSTALQEFIPTQAVTGLIQSSSLVIDLQSHQALLRGRTLNLTELQYNLLVYLLEQVGQVVSNSELERALWAEDYVDDPERLKSVVKGLRRALAESADFLENVRGVGYRWRE